MLTRLLPDNKIFWLEYAPSFEKAKAEDPQPIWFFQDHLFKGLDFTKKPLILDIGCGSGRGMKTIQEITGFYPLGMDLCNEVLQMAIENGVPKANLKLADILKTPLEEKYDVIWVSDLLLYFQPEAELDNALKNILNGLKKGGRLGLRWSSGKDHWNIRKTNAMFLVRAEFIRGLFDKYGLKLTFLEKKTEPVYVAGNKQRGGKRVFSDFWYAIAYNPLT